MAENFQGFDQNWLEKMYEQSQNDSRLKLVYPVYANAIEITLKKVDGEIVAFDATGEVQIAPVEERYFAKHDWRSGDPNGAHVLNSADKPKMSVGRKIVGSIKALINENPYQEGKVLHTVMKEILDEEGIDVTKLVDKCLQQGIKHKSQVTGAVKILVERGQVSQ